MPVNNLVWVGLAFKNGMPGQLKHLTDGNLGFCHRRAFFDVLWKMLFCSRVAWASQCSLGASCHMDTLRHVAASESIAGISVLLYVSLNPSVKGGAI